MNVFQTDAYLHEEHTIKQDHIKSSFKESKGKVKEVAGGAVRVREPGHEKIPQNAHFNIEAAYADLRNDYKKSG